MKAKHQFFFLFFSTITQLSHFKLYSNLIPPNLQQEGINYSHFCCINSLRICSIHCKSRLKTIASRCRHHVNPFNFTECHCSTRVPCTAYGTLHCCGTSLNAARRPNVIGDGRHGGQQYFFHSLWQKSSIHIFFIHTANICSVLMFSLTRKICCFAQQC